MESWPALCLNCGIYAWVWISQTKRIWVLYRGKAEITLLTQPLLMAWYVLSHIVITSADLPQSLFIVQSMVQLIPTGPRSINRLIDHLIFGPEPVQTTNHLLQSLFGARSRLLKMVSVWFFDPHPSTTAVFRSAKMNCSKRGKEPRTMWIWKHPWSQMILSVFAKLLGSAGVLCNETTAAS